MTITFRGVGAESTGTAQNLHAHAEGRATIASGIYSHSEGLATTASGAGSHAGGNGCTASGDYSRASGNGTTASYTYSYAFGNLASATAVASRAYGVRAIASKIGQNAHNGVVTYPSGMTRAQANDFYMCITTGASGANTLQMDPTAGFTLTGPTANVIALPVKTMMLFRANVVARRTDVQGEHAGFVVTGTAVRDATGNARLVATPTVTAMTETNSSTWTVTADINTSDSTNNFLRINVNGQDSKTIQWYAHVATVELVTNT